MTETALFLDIEASAPEPSGFPVAVAWSTREGEVRQVLILPDDDWPDWESAGFSHPDISWQHLLDHGISCKDALRLLNQDLGGETVYVDGLDYDEDWLERMAEAADATIQFELAPFTQCSGYQGADWYDERERRLSEAGLEPYRAEHNVRIMLQAAGLIPESDVW